MIKICKIHCLSEALSPITHMMGVSGNESVLNRESVLYNGTIRQIPFISGNALRHKMIREPGALHLVKACGLEGKLNLDQANYLFNGGSLTESSATENLGKIAEMQELLPLIRLLGGSLRNQVIGGSLIVGRGILVCEENRETIQKMLPEAFTFPEHRLRSAEDFINQYQYTRGDAQKRSDAGKLIGEKETDGTNLMIYSGQSVIRGAVFYHNFIMQNISELEIGALLNALHEWDNLGGTIGGYGRIGHGKLKLSFSAECYNDSEEIDITGIVKRYREYCDKNRDKITDWLTAAFPKKEKKAKPEKKLAKELAESAQGELI
ncbi:hypothetical protein FACS1894151_08790 [Spirochaetia bacterium]|nr:hypothetical protein FACS1894151_08790 [Spirochaetia bacterium]